VEIVRPFQVWVAPGRAKNTRIEAHRLAFVPGEDKVFVAHGSRNAVSTAIWDPASGEVEHLEATVDGEVKAVAATPAGSDGLLLPMRGPVRVRFWSEMLGLRGGGRICTASERGAIGLSSAVTESSWSARSRTAPSSSGT
jgi:hypothetical protein